MPAAESDHLAQIAYAVWRATSPHLLPDWEQLTLPDRHRWRLAAEGTTAEEVRERCCIGQDIVPWWQTGMQTRWRWREVARAISQARAEAA